MEAVKTRILLIEDNHDDALLFEEALSELPREEIEVEHAVGMQAGLKLLRSASVDVVVLDLGLPDIKTAVAVKTLLDDNPAVPVAVLTGLEDPDLRSLAFEQGAQVFLRKRDLSPELIHRVLVLSQSREQQLTELASWSALGRLAAGVAHEINNPMSYVMLNLGLLRGDVEEMGEVCPELAAGPVQTALELVDECLDGARRMTAIVKDLSLFSAVQSEEMTRVDMVEVVHAAVRTVRRLVEPWARIHLDLEPVPTIVGDRPRLVQVVANLLANAGQALEASGAPGAVRVALSRTADTLRLTVDDTGPGISEALAQRMFEPFFTTRLGSGGTGLGLSIARASVERHGGRISVSSHAPGARLEVELPVLNGLRLSPRGEKRNDD
ncbi:MAG: ATP-binding protein, partial [Myxococcota bacterium]